ncbi:hypothetical protein [Colwellia sp. TT2012]|uniref:hypothetical protein n=1 Tax=Colwellia sp. TT2012 TaxID=1720342 RepID=UPI0007110A18|nr:hypothetical protein [Colwellia sp. TT2012]
MLAAQWIKENINESASLSNESLSSVSSFTLMWAVFEASESDPIHNMVTQIQRLSIRVANEMPPIDFLDDILQFWQNRYIQNNAKGSRFEHLGFSEHEQEELVFSILTEQSVNLADKIHALLLITYRFRNNLFHGNKDITLLEDQTENFNNASLVLQRVMLISRRYLYLGA